MEKLVLPAAASTSSPSISMVGASRTAWQQQQQLKSKPQSTWTPKREWNLTEEAGRESQVSLLGWAQYPSDSAAAHLNHYDSLVRQHLGPPPNSTNLPVFKSYMTDDHTSMEFSLCWRESEGKMMAPDLRYAIEPAGSSARQLKAGAVRANLVAAGNMLAATCGVEGPDHMSKLLWEKMIWHGQPGHQHGRLVEGNLKEEDDRELMYSQTFLAWELGRKLNKKCKAYSLPFVLSGELRTPAINLLERLVTGTPYAGPLATIMSYMATLPEHLRPSFCFVSSDVLPAGSNKLNRLKAYFRLKSSKFSHIQQVLGLGRDLPPDHAQAYSDLWESITGSPPPDREGDFDAAPDSYPVVYYDLAPASADDAEKSTMMRSSKLYIPVRYLAPHDDKVAGGLEQFLKRSGYRGWQGYRDALASTFTHRPLAARAGLHTYVSCHFKDPKAAMPEITPYLSPEVYAPERYHLLYIDSLKFSP